MNKKQFRAFLDLIMCCDPWPVDDTLATETNEWMVKDFASAHARTLGFTDWVDAYHRLQPTLLSKSYTTEESKNVAKIQYEESDEYLDVTFQSGAEYRYFEIPMSVYEAAYASPSIGAFLSSDIKGKYRYAKVN